MNTLSAHRLSLPCGCVLVALAASAWAQTQPQTLPMAPPTTPVAQPAPAQPLPAARWTPAQIREAFDTADSDSNGELSRAEAQRMAILPRSFEDMDQNKDGVLVRTEYEAAFPR